MPTTRRRRRSVVLLEPARRPPRLPRRASRAWPTSDVVLPDLRGFGDSDRHELLRARDARPRPGRERAAPIEGRARPPGAGRLRHRQPPSPSGSRARRTPSVPFSPPLPGAGDRILTQDGMREFWTSRSTGCRCRTADRRQPRAVRAYLGHGTGAAAGPAGPPTASTSWSTSTRVGRLHGQHRVVPRGAGAVAQSASEQPPGEPLAVPPPSCGASTSRVPVAAGRGPRDWFADFELQSGRASATSRRSRRRTRSPRLRPGSTPVTITARRRRRSRPHSARRGGPRAASATSRRVRGRRLGPSRLRDDRVGRPLLTISSSARKAGPLACTAARRPR